MHLKYGVSQGSVLGPRLYCLFSKPIGEEEPFQLNGRYGMQIANHLKANLAVNDIQDVKLPPFQESLIRTISLIQDGNFSAHRYPSLTFLEVVVQ
jgi:hypothetical protein